MRFHSDTSQDRSAPLWLSIPVMLLFGFGLLGVGIMVLVSPDQNSLTALAPFGFAALIFVLFALVLRGAIISREPSANKIRKGVRLFLYSYINPMSNEDIKAEDESDEPDDIDATPNVDYIKGIKRQKPPASRYTKSVRFIRMQSVLMETTCLC